MKKHFYYQIGALFLVFLFLGCPLPESETKSDHLTVISWNVQNLFDGKDDGFEYTDFQTGSGWNREKYKARLEKITAAFKGENGIKADIMALVEVENRGVIRDLADKTFLDYPWSFFAGNENNSVGLGVLSILPITETRVHSIHSGDGSIPRPVAEVWVDTGEGPLVLLVCHWKSKLEGDEKTESTRRFAAALIARRLAEIDAEKPGTPVIILGDLNENYDEFNRIGFAYPCALLPDSAEAAELLQKFPAAVRPEFQDFLVLSGKKPPELHHVNSCGGLVYSPWYELEEQTPEDKPLGSYYYKGDWETIDHFLLNSALFRDNALSYKCFWVMSEPPFTNAAGRPDTYNPRTGNGFSDHLPIVLVLNKSGY